MQTDRKWVRVRKQNTFIELIRFFRTDENPLTSTEFHNFWESLTNEEKEYYTYVNLETGLLPFWK